MVDDSINICWWETTLTDHQAFTLVELKRFATVSVFVVRNDHEERKNQGWISSTATSLSPVKIPDWSLGFIWKSIYLNRRKVHVFGGPFEHPKLMLAALFGIIVGARVYFLSEPYSTATHGLLRDTNKIVNIFKAKLRPLLYSFYGMIYLKYVKGILAVSPLAAKQLMRMGAKKAQIFPFGYFVPAIPRTVVSDSPETIFKAVFVGTLNGTKGVDILSRTIHSLNSVGYQIELDVYGPGDTDILGDKLEGVKYCGIIPFGDTQRVVSSYDLFILPSRYDGWGVVINEALLAGVPVLCSDRVGASALVKYFDCGKVYALENALELENSLISLISDRSQLERMKAGIRKVQMAIEPKVAAQYIIKMIEADDQNVDQINSCPWYEIS